MHPPPASAHSQLCARRPPGPASASVGRRLTTRGGALLDASGAPVRFVGVNWFGFNTKQENWVSFPVVSGSGWPGGGVARAQGRACKRGVRLCARPPTPLHPAPPL